jgi:hypothetical protein
MVERWKKPNAFKHGIFVRSATVLPGEDKKEYWQLVDELVEEWKPDGAAELEAVLTIADATWRKLRAQRYRRSRLLQNSLDIKHPSFDEHLGYAIFFGEIATRPENFDVAAAVFLHPAKIAHLKRKYPRQNFASTEEWLQAIEDELTLETEIKPPPDLPEEMMAAFKSLEATADKCGHISRAAQTFTDDVFERELAIDERLDAIIDKAIKRLIQIKAAKQALGLARPVAVVVDQPTKNAAARISERVKRSARRPNNR